MYIVKTYFENGEFNNAFFYPSKKLALTFADRTMKLKPLCMVKVYRIMFDSDGELYTEFLN